jgi:hypothetical protein
LKTSIALLLVFMVAALLVSQAMAGCGKWVVRETTDYLDDPVFEDAVADSTGLSATMNADSSLNQSQESNKTDATKPATVVKDEQVSDLAGKWKLVLQQDPKASMDLILIQSGDRLQGYGTLAENGADIPATAMGSISKDAVSLEVKLNKQKQDYNLDLLLTNGGLEGSYELYDDDKLSQSGNATAVRS